MMFSDGHGRTGERMRFLFKGACLGVLVLAMQPAHSAPVPAPLPTEVKNERKAAAPDPMIGVVINRTVTVMGKDFYQYFAANWRDKEMSERYSISIHEKPSAIRGSEMWVQFGQRKVFHTFMSPARSAVKETSAQAAEIAYKNVVELEVQRLLFQDKDLAQEEL